MEKAKASKKKLKKPPLPQFGYYHPNTGIPVYENFPEWDDFDQFRLNFAKVYHPSPTLQNLQAKLPPQHQPNVSNLSDLDEYL